MDSHLADATADGAQQMATTPLPAAGWYPDPAMAGTIRYWDGAAWTDHRAPAAGQTTGPPAVTGAPGTTEVPDETSFVWLLALLPLLWLGFDLVAPQYSLSTTVVFVATSLNGALATADSQRLARRGIRLSPLWGWLLMPVYLIQRTRRAGSTVAIPLVFFVTFAVYMVAVFTFAATYQLTEADIDHIERSLEQSSSIDNLTVDCPDTVVSNGDRLWCTVRGGGETADLTVDFSTSGTDFIYSWQVQN
jgi:hypothetical protein